MAVKHSAVWHASCVGKVNKQKAELMFTKVQSKLDEHVIRHINTIIIIVFVLWWAWRCRPGYQKIYSRDKAQSARPHYLICKNLSIPKMDCCRVFIYDRHLTNDHSRMTNNKDLRSGFTSAATWEDACRFFLFKRRTSKLKSQEIISKDWISPE